MKVRVSKQQYGFTLLEILVATAIFSFIAVISYSSLSDALLVRERTEKFNEELSDLALAIQIMDKDLRQIINRPVRDPNGSDIARPAISIGSNENAIEFTHTGWPNPLHQLRNELQRSALILEEEKLIKQYWPTLDRDGSNEGKKITLLDNISEVTVRALDKDSQWQSFWPSSNTASTDMPKALEVVINSQQWGEIRRVYEVIQ